MNAIRNRSRGFVRTTLVVMGLVGAGFFAVASFVGGDRRDGVSEHELTFTAYQGDFTSSIIESGDVASSRNTEIRCRVRERGGIAILKIVDEGTMVKKDDFLVQLEDSGFRDEVVERKIRVAEDRASVIQAESDLNTARRSLTEFENGKFRQELATYEAEQAFAEETLRRAKEYRQYSENLARKGYVTKAQLEADQFAVVKATKELELAQSKLEVFRDFSQQTMEAELKAAIQKLEADLEASNFTLELSKQRLQYYEDQVEACRIVAPTDGQVVYANEIDGRGESGIVIEEGVTIREGQAIIQLPDPENMQVTTKVNDSKINSIKAGQQAIIRLDTAPETPIRGRVRKVANFPLPRRWSQAPIEYEVYVDIIEKSPMVRPGLRAKVEIFVEQVADSIQVPVSCLIERNKTYFVVVKQNDRHELRSVEIGPHNESTVIVTRGLEIGTSVLVDPDDYREQKTPSDSQDSPANSTSR